MRVALFGGSFDPPHRGHIAVARAAADAFALDEVLFAPTGRQPLKREGTPFATRFEMIEAACLEDARFVASTADAPRSDGSPNYTVDTLAALRRARPHDRIFNLVGADSFLSLRQWREPERLLDLAEWIVATRPGYSLTDNDLAGLHLNRQQLARVHLLPEINEDVSATGLRDRLRRGDPCLDLLPERVAALVQERRVYR